MNLHLNESLSSTEVNLQVATPATRHGKFTVLGFLALFLLVPLVGLMVIYLSIPEIEQKTYDNLQAVIELKATQVAT